MSLLGLRSHAMWRNIRGFTALSRNPAAGSSSRPLVSSGFVVSGPIRAPRLGLSRAAYSSTATTSPSPQSQKVMAAEPTGFIAKSGIELLTSSTPNGYKASILLEELRETYGREYTWQAVNIARNTQKQPWFTAAGANGRIPVIVDHDRDGFAVFEGMAILGYLTRRYDAARKYTFAVGSREYDEAEMWMAWQHGGLGPMQGQANHFVRFAGERIAYAAQRYVGEAERLYGVLDARLAGRAYVVGDKFSIADISILGWANFALFAGVDVEVAFPRVHAWIERCCERPAVQRGFAIPFALPFGNAQMKRDLEGDAEKRIAFEGLKKFVDDAKEQFGYKYASP
ncbi:glutathione S-transferase [Xylaria sp. CBS 124048]|nr:glutathione S-transferase [Xylaria sp. CBS 124048]